MVNKILFLVNLKFFFTFQKCLGHSIAFPITNIKNVTAKPKDPTPPRSLEFLTGTVSIVYTP